MIKYQRISGLNLSGAALSTIQTTPEGRAMGAVPGWRVLIDPAYMVGGAPRNRAMARSVATTSEAVSVNTFYGTSEPCFRVDYPLSVGAPIRGLINFSPTEWSVCFAAVVPLGKALALTEFMNRSGSGVAGEIAPRIAMTASGNLTLYDGTNSNLRASVSSAFIAGNPLAVVISFSELRGISIFINGELRAETGDVRPLNIGFLDDGYEILRATSSGVMDLGMFGILNTDLSAPENIGNRRAIEGFLMTKYGIAA